MPFFQMHPESAAPGELSSQERRMMRGDTEHEAWQRTKAARSILHRQLSDLTWDELMRDPTRGEVAAQLYATWGEKNRSEPFMCSDYAVTGIYEDLRLAMNAHGISTYQERCLELGQKLVEGAITYIMQCHERDADAVHDALREERELEIDEDRR